MGLRADKDSRKLRYIYYLIDHKGSVLYVGTAINPKQRYKSHLKRSITGNAIIYQYVRKHEIKLRLKVVLKITSTYAYAEQIEIQHIANHKGTVLNFYNNPNKKRLDKIKETL